MEGQISISDYLRSWVYVTAAGDRAGVRQASVAAVVTLSTRSENDAKGIKRTGD